MKIHRSLPLAVAALAILGAGCAASAPQAGNPSTPPSAMTASQAQETLKQDLERAYAQTRAFWDDPTPDRYLAAVDFTGAGPEDQQEIRSGWAFRDRVKTIVVPDLGGPDVKFIQAVQDGEWAGYYFLLKGEGELAAIKLQRFRKAPSGWRVGTAALQPEPMASFEAFDRAALVEKITASPVLRLQPSPATNSAYGS